MVIQGLLTKRQGIDIQVKMRSHITVFTAEFQELRLFCKADAGNVTAKHAKDIGIFEYLARQAERDARGVQVELVVGEQCVIQHVAGRCTGKRIVKLQILFFKQCQVQGAIAEMGKKARYVPKLKHHATEAEQQWCCLAVKAACRELLFDLCHQGCISRINDQGARFVEVVGQYLKCGLLVGQFSEVGAFLQFIVQASRHEHRRLGRQDNFHPAIQVAQQFFSGENGVQLFRQFQLVGGPGSVGDGSENKCIAGGDVKNEINQTVHPGEDGQLVSGRQFLIEIRFYDVVAYSQLPVRIGLLRSPNLIFFLGS